MPFRGRQPGLGAGLCVTTPSRRYSCLDRHADRGLTSLEPASIGCCLKDCFDHGEMLSPLRRGIRSMVANLVTSDNVLAQDPDTRYVRDRMPWNPAVHAIPVSGTRLKINRAAELADVIHLSIGQPDFGTPKHIVDAFVHALQAGQTGYTMDAGLPELLTALKDYYSERYRSTLSEDNFLVTTGATEGIYLLLTGMAAPGREFILADPTFLLYAPLIRMNGGQVRTVSTKASEGHQIDPERIINMIRPNTHAIVLNSPNNPTGTVYP